MISLLRLAPIAAALTSVAFIAAACSVSVDPAVVPPPPVETPIGDAGGQQALPPKEDPPPRPITDTPPAPVPDKAPLPELTSIAPEKAFVGGIGPTLVVTGKGFVPRSVVKLEGAALPTSYTSPTELKATVKSTSLATVARLKVTVFTPAPGGGTTSEATFAVENPKPELTEIAPLFALAGAPNTLLTVTGTGFVTGAKIMFGTNELATTLKSDTRLEATISNTLLSTSRSVAVKVINPIPGGGTTTDINFTVTNPSATVTSVTPNTASVTRTTALDIAVVGTGFVQGSAIVFNGTPLATTILGSDRLTASIPVGSFTAVGDLPVAVSNPPPGGGVSNPVPFTVTYPLPTVAITSGPLSIKAGSGPTVLTVNGTRFFPATYVTVDDQRIFTEFVDDKKIKATIDAPQLAVAGRLKVKVVTPPPGGGTAATELTVEVTNEQPTITTINPSAVPKGSPDTLLTIFGTNFLPTSTVRFKTATATATPSTYLDGQKLTVLAPAALFEAGGASINVFVTNPGPGGGTSALTVASKVIVQCAPIEVNHHLETTVQELTIDWATSPKVSRWAANGGTCPNVPLFPEEQPSHYVVVQNATGGPITMSAWAKCTDDKGDAFMTFYKKDKSPATEDEREQCTGVVSQGGATHKSPESSGSSFCPGLLKANTAGLKLEACEVAVVQVQTYRYEEPGVHSAPPSIKIKGE